MSSYSGSASFTFEVERYKNRDTGELVVADLVPESADELEYEYQLIKLKVEGTSYFQSGRYYGPPENCYPDEGDTEITSVIGPNKENWSQKLSSEEEDKIIDMITEQAQEGEPDFDEDYYDDSDY